MTFLGSVIQQAEDFGDDLRVVSAWWTADTDGKVDAELDGL